MLTAFFTPPRPVRLRFPECRWRQQHAAAPRVNAAGRAPELGDVDPSHLPGPEIQTIPLQGRGLPNNRGGRHFGTTESFRFSFDNCRAGPWLRFGKPALGDAAPILT